MTLCPVFFESIIDYWLNRKPRILNWSQSNHGWVVIFNIQLFKMLEIIIVHSTGCQVQSAKLPYDLNIPIKMQLHLTIMCNVTALQFTS